MHEFRQALRVVWLALILLFALLIGATGGLLSWIDTHRAAAALLYGAGAFAAAVGLLVAV